MQHRWSAEQLPAKFAAEHPPEKPPPGRPHKPELLKWLGAVRHTSGGARDPAGFTQEFSQLTDAEKAKFKADLAALQQELAAMLALI